MTDDHNDGAGVDVGEEDDRAYQVGYGRPPVAHRFQPGQSGNPKGRRKGARSLRTDFLEMLKTPVPIIEEGKRRKVSTQQAVLMRLREKALKGDAKAIDQWIRLAQALNGDPETASAETRLSADDQAIIDAYLARRERTTAKRKGGEND
jgi:hypothetical protein